tara:strand:+ start:186 stop:497 length:312 start_codon:yes stop_codon:yes gene_type:complete
MEQIVDFNIYNYSIHEMEKLCNLKKNYIFSDISIQAIKTKKNIMQTFNLNSMKELEIDIFFQNLISRLERNLLNKNLNMLLENQNEIKQMIKDMVVSVNLDDI